MKTNTHRWLLSLTIIVVVISASIALIFTSRTPSGNIALKTVSDTSGNAFVAWYQDRSIHVQKVGSDGNLLWSKEMVLENTRLNEPDHFNLVEDGRGGVIVTWGSMFDTLSFNPVPVYSLRLNAEGQSLWGRGVPTGAGEHYGFSLTLPQIMPDDTGGAYLLWNDFKTVFNALHDDYFRLERISPDGKVLWEKLLFSSPPFHTTTPEEAAQGEKGVVTRSWPVWSSIDVVGDGHGGVIVVWEEETQNRYYSILAQRYNVDGQPVWPEGGILIFSAWDAGIQVTADGDGGAVVIIGAGSQDPAASAAYRVQRITAGGKLLWPDAGVVIEENLRFRGNIEVIPQGKEIVLLWQEPVGKPDIKNGLLVQQIAVNAERISAEGKIVWQKTPVFTSQAGESFSDLVMVGDNEGVLLAWRSGVREQWGGKVLARKLNLTGGELAWGEEELPVFGTGLRYQGPPAMVSDGSGGALILTAAGRSPLNGDMVYAQRLDTSGNLLWGEGMKVSR